MGSLQRRKEGSLKKKCLKMSRSTWNVSQASTCASHSRIEIGRDWDYDVKGRHGLA